MKAAIAPRMSKAAAIHGNMVVIVVVIVIVVVVVVEVVVVVVVLVLVGRAGYGGRPEYPDGLLITSMQCHSEFIIHVRGVVLYCWVDWRR